jgi:hypothetical protein
LIPFLLMSRTDNWGFEADAPALAMVLRLFRFPKPPDVFG